MRGRDPYARSVERMFTFLQRRLEELTKHPAGERRDDALAWCDFIVRTTEGRHVGVMRRWMPMPLPPDWRVLSRPDFALATFPPDPAALPELRETVVTFRLLPVVSSMNTRVYLADEREF